MAQIHRKNDAVGGFPHQIWLSLQGVKISRKFDD